MECAKKIQVDDWEEGIYITVIKHKVVKNIDYTPFGCVAVQQENHTGMESIYKVLAVNYPCVLLLRVFGFGVDEDTKPSQWNINEYHFGKLSDDYVSKALGPVAQSG